MRLGGVVTRPSSGRFHHELPAKIAACRGNRIWASIPHGKRYSFLLGFCEDCPRAARGGSRSPRKTAHSSSAHLVVPRELRSAPLGAPTARAKHPYPARSRIRCVMACGKMIPSESWSISFSTKEPAPRRWRRRERRGVFAREMRRFQLEQRRRLGRHPAEGRRQERHSILLPPLAVAAAPTRRRDATSTDRGQAAPNGGPNDRHAANGPIRELGACPAAQMRAFSRGPSASANAEKVRAPTKLATAGRIRIRSADNAAVPASRLFAVPVLVLLPTQTKPAATLGGTLSDVQRQRSTILVRLPAKFQQEQAKKLSRDR